jgi:hypothetical protein
VRQLSKLFLSQQEGVDILPPMYGCNQYTCKNRTQLYKRRLANTPRTLAAVSLMPFLPTREGIAFSREGSQRRYASLMTSNKFYGSVVLSCFPVTCVHRISPLNKSLTRGTMFRIIYSEQRSALSPYHSPVWAFTFSSCLIVCWRWYTSSGSTT